jgi:Sec-independent protein translocase protein TatA
VSFSPLYIVVALILGVLFFGKDLPNVVRQIGSALLEFRKGINEWKEVQQKADSGSKKRESAAVPPDVSERFEAVGTKFEPPTDWNGG